LTVAQEDQATPTAAPATRQLRHTRSQSARRAPAAPGSTDAKAKQAAEVSTGVDEEDVDILALAMSSASSGEVDITGSPAVAVFAALHAALPLGHLQEVSCCCLLLQSSVGCLGCSQLVYLKAGLLA